MRIIKAIEKAQGEINKLKINIYITRRVWVDWDHNIVLLVTEKGIRIVSQYGGCAKNCLTLDDLKANDWKLIAPKMSLVEKARMIGR